MVAIVTGKELGRADNAPAIDQAVAQPSDDGSLGQAGTEAAVNAVSGNLLIRTCDAAILTGGPDLVAARAYNSLQPASGANADGWRWLCGPMLRFQGPGTPDMPEPASSVVRVAGDGHETVFRWDQAQAAFIASEGFGARDVLRYDPAASVWTLQDGATQTTETYDASMTGDSRLIRSTDVSNRSTMYGYDNDRLISIKDASSNQELHIEYAQINGHARARSLESSLLLNDGDNRPTATVGGRIRLADYEYDGLGRLTDVARYLNPGASPLSASFKTRYEYDGASNRLQRIVEGDGAALSIAFDQAGRVEALSGGVIGAVPELRFAYDAQGASSTVEDGFGQLWAYRYDDLSGAVVEAAAPVPGGGASAGFSYGADGQWTGVSDANGAASVVTRDAAGNALYVRGAAGNVARRTFNSFRQVLTETRYRSPDLDSAGPGEPDDPVTKRYVYDSANRLRFAISPEGRVTESRYHNDGGGQGLPSQTLIYTAQRFDVSGLAPTQAPDEAEMAAWVNALADKSQVELTEFAYDQRGNMQRQTTFAAVDAGGHGLSDASVQVVDFNFDAFGRLRQRAVQRGPARDLPHVVDALVYDGLHRPIERNGASGPETTAYDDANRRIVRTLASGLIETREHDDHGRATLISQTDGATTRATRLVYDRAGRLRMVEDAAGGRRFHFYDTAGRAAFLVDATGAVREFEGDKAGRVIRDTLYANRVETKPWFDLASKTVTKETLTVGGAADDVVRDPAKDRTNSYEYDQEGRLIASTDAEGAVTRRQYDGLSQLVLTHAGKRTTRYFYDADGRCTGTVDPQGYLVEHRYNAAGRMVETVRYMERSPLAANASDPVWVGAADQMLVAGQWFDHRVPAIDVDGDALTLSVVGVAPAWLNFDAATATMSGRPPAVGIERVTLRAQDGRGGVADIVMRFVIAASPPAPATPNGPAWGDLSVLDAEAGASVSHVVPAALGASLAYEVVGGLPCGLVFDAATREISGSAAAPGFYDLRLRASDGSGATERTLSIRIRAPANTQLPALGSRQLADWRPVSTDALSAHFFYDGCGRIVGKVDERQFLSESIYDEGAGTHQSLRYSSPVAVLPNDDLATLRSRAGAAIQIAQVEQDAFARPLSETTADGSITRYEYDESGRLYRLTRAAGTTDERAKHTFRNTYGQVIAELGGEGSAWLGANPSAARTDEAIRDYATRYEHDALGRVARSVDARGHRTLFYYDRESRQTHVVAVVGQAEDGTLGGEVDEVVFNAFGQPDSTRRYARRISAADMAALLADGGGAVSVSLSSILAALADPAEDEMRRFAYDRRGAVVEMIDAEGAVSRAAFNEHGQVAAQTRFPEPSQGVTRQFDYDLNGRLICVTDDPGGANASSQTRHDALGRIVGSVDALGRTSTSDYPDCGRSIVAVDRLGAVTRTEHDALDRPVRTINALGGETRITYDDAARTVTSTSPAGNVAIRRHTPHGEASSVVDGRGHETTHKYDRDGRLVGVIDARGQPGVQLRYSNHGLKLGATDSRGTVTRFSYDERNRLVEEWLDPGGLDLKTRITFDTLGRKATETRAADTPDAQVAAYFYDRQGRVVRSVVDADAQGAQLCTSYAYDGLGAVVRVAQGTVASPDQRVTVSEFDRLGRCVREIEAPALVFGPSSNGDRDLTTETVFDRCNRRTRNRDASGASQWFFPDAEGRVAFRASALGELTESRYDSVGRIIYQHGYAERLSAAALAAIDQGASPATPSLSASDRRRHFVYDQDGRMRFALSAVDHERWTVSETRYDNCGNAIESRVYPSFLSEARVAFLAQNASAGIAPATVAQELSALGYDDGDTGTLTKVQRTHTAYDALNRPRFVTDATGTVVESIYDAGGFAVARIAFATRSTLSGYDEAAFDAAVDRNDPGNLVVRAAHDAAGRARFSIDAIGSVVETRYDRRSNVIASVRWSTRPTLTAYDADAIAAALAAAPAARENAVTRRVYDRADRLRFSINEVGAISERRYDGLRLTAVTRFAAAPALTDYSEAVVDAAVAPMRGTAQAPTERFVYDAANRLCFSIDALGAVVETRYAPAGQVASLTHYAAAPVIAQFDEASVLSALASMPANASNRKSHLVYDANGRKRFSVDALGGVEEHVYDAFGVQIGKEAFAVRPALTEYSGQSIDATVAGLRGSGANRIDRQVTDASGAICFQLTRIGSVAGAERYGVVRLERNALGDLLQVTSFADSVALGAFDIATIVQAAGAGDVERDRLIRFSYDLAGRQHCRAEAVTSEAGQRLYRISAQKLDAFGRTVRSTSQARLSAIDDGGESIEQAAKANADAAADRTVVFVHDLAGRPIYTLRSLSAGVMAVEETAFDLLGNAQSVTQYAVTIAPLGDYSLAAVRAALLGHAGQEDRRAVFVHDLSGRKRFILRAERGSHWSVGASAYDLFGNLVEARRYDKYLDEAWIAALLPQHAAGVTEADVAGKLAALGYDEGAPATLAGLQRTRFCYDARDRLRFSIDALGGVAEDVHNLLGDKVATVRFAAPIEVTELSEAAVAQLTNRRDRDNRVRNFVYDAKGQLRFDLRVVEPNADSVGRHFVVESRYDALGQLTEHRAYATSVGYLYVYSEAVVAAAIVADPERDRVSIVVHDAGGRQVYALRQAGSAGAGPFVATHYERDARGQVLHETAYAALAPIAGFDSGSVEAAIVVTPGADRCTTRIYDAAGRQRFEINAELGFSERCFDAFDQIVETRLFDTRAPDRALLRESELAALRGQQRVGDGATRGEGYSYDLGGRRTGVVDALGHGFSQTYDALGNCVARTNKLGAQWRCAYDRAGRLISETAPAVRFTLADENPVSEAPERGIESRFNHDALGNRVQVVEAANFPADAATVDFSFDVLGRATATLPHGFYDPVLGSVERDAAPGRFRREARSLYNVFGEAVRFQRRIASDAFETSYATYDRVGAKVHEVNALGHVIRHLGNAFGEDDAVMRFGVTVTGVPANGHHWIGTEIDEQLTVHDTHGNLIMDPTARTIRIAYDALGRKASVTQPTVQYYSTSTPGDAAQSQRFRANPPSATTVEDAALTRYEYNAFGDVVATRVRANVVVEWQLTSFLYDPMGRLIDTTDAAGSRSTNVYDVAGNMIQHEERTGGDGRDRLSAVSYDLLNRQVRVDRYGLRYADANGTEHGVATWTYANGGEWLDPDGQTITTVLSRTYDAEGRVLTVTDAMGNTTATRYDALGRLVHMTAPARSAVRTPPTPAVVDPFYEKVSEALVVKMTLDLWGRPVRQVRARASGGDARQIRQAYDAAGNLVTTTDAAGNVKRRAYDAAGRVSRETQAIVADLGPLGVNRDGIERRFVHDAVGQLTDTLDVYNEDGQSVQSGKSVVYNPFGEVVEERRTWGPASAAPSALNSARVATYRIDLAGRVAEKTAGDGLTVYFYNLLGQVTREEKRGNSGSTGYRITEMDYDILGRPTMIRRPAFDADITAGSGTVRRLMTPYSTRSYDRWSNVTGTQQGGFEVVNGQPSYAPNRIFRSYQFDDNNQPIGESLGTHGYTTASGLQRTAIIRMRRLRDLLGNVIREVDEARDPQSEQLIASRTRAREYNEVGQLVAEIDATNRKVEYALNIHGERLATRNARGTVMLESRDESGNLRATGVLRALGSNGREYNSFARQPGVTLVRTLLSEHLYDQANRRFATKVYLDGTDAPWAYTWLDGRNFGVIRRDVIGLVKETRFDPFGNKSKEDSGKEWHSSTQDYSVGRIETYRQPDNAGTVSGQFFYNDFGERTQHNLGNTITWYSLHRNGLVAQINMMPDVTRPNEREITNYLYDVSGQLTMEGRIYQGAQAHRNFIQTIMISYDNQGRLARVEDQNKAPFTPMSDVQYAYDEWGNVRCIRATYSRTQSESPQTAESWYTYDDAGRMIISDGGLANGQIGLKASTSKSVMLEYDNVGRRSKATQFLRHSISSFGPRDDRSRSFDEMRDEAYAYNDLGHLLQIDQRVRRVNVVSSTPENPHREDPDVEGNWGLLSKRTSNLRGDVTTHERWVSIFGMLQDFVYAPTPELLGTTTNLYRSDGKVVTTNYSATDPKKSTSITNTYMGLTDVVDYYDFDAFRSDGSAYHTRYQYRYGVRNGQRIVRSIRDSANGADTLKTYDTAGRLSFEHIELAKPDGQGSDRYEERRYAFDAQGRVIYKDSRLRLFNTSSSVPLPNPSTGQQAYVYAGDRTVGTLGAERFSFLRQFDFAYTPMSEARGSPASYVVQSGDSLISIAEACYGDGALWLQIADANGVSADPAYALPETEIGRTYIVLEALRSSRSATTFHPYDLGAVLGNDRPVGVPPPRPPHYSDIEYMLVSGAAITVHVVATVGLTALGVPAPISAAVGAGLSNLAGQTTAWQLGMTAPGQDGIDWTGVGRATLSGYATSLTGGPLSRELVQQALGGFGDWRSDGGGADLAGIGGSVLNVGVSMLGSAVAREPFGPEDETSLLRYTVRHGADNSTVLSLIGSAYNPRSGWALHGRPVVGMFEYAYGAVAPTLVAKSFDWIIVKLSEPTPPEPAPRYVNPLGPMPQGQIDAWDELDRAMLARLDEEQNRRTDAGRAERVKWLGALGALEEQIAHAGGGIDDRIAIKAAIRANNRERVFAEQQKALRRAIARERADAAQRKLEAHRRADIARAWEDYFNEDSIVKGMYADGTWTNVSEIVVLDGLGYLNFPDMELETRSGVYDSSGLYTRKHAEMDQVGQMYTAASRRGYGSSPVWINNELAMIPAQAPGEPMMAYHEVIIIRDVDTPASFARRTKWDSEGMNFETFSRAYQRQHNKVEGVEQAFIDFQITRSKEVQKSWRRVDAACNVVNWIGGTTIKFVLSGGNPVVTFAPAAIGKGAALGAEALWGVDELEAQMIGDVAETVADLGIGLRAPSAFDAPIERVFGRKSVQQLLAAQRAVRAESDLARLSAQAIEWELSKGIPVGEGVMLFKRMTPEALAAKPGGAMAARLTAGEAPTLSLALTRPSALTRPTAPAMLSSAANFASGAPSAAVTSLARAVPATGRVAMTHVMGMTDALAPMSYEARMMQPSSNAFEPRPPQSSLIAYATTGSGGFSGRGSVIGGGGGSSRGPLVLSSRNMQGYGYYGYRILEEDLTPIKAGISNQSLRDRVSDYRYGRRDTDIEVRERAYFIARVTRQTSRYQTLLWETDQNLLNLDNELWIARRFHTTEEMKSGRYFEDVLQRERIELQWRQWEIMMAPWR